MTSAHYLPSSATPHGKLKGSHIIFQRGSSFLNLQPSTGGKAKVYQVRQVREEL